MASQTTREAPSASALGNQDSPSFSDALLAGVLVAVKELTFTIRDLSETMAARDGRADWQTAARRRPGS